MKIFNYILRGVLYSAVITGAIILTFFTAEAFDYYIIKTITAEDVKENETALFLFCLKNQSSVTRFQATQIQRLTKEKQEIIDRALDLQVENLELRKAVKRNVDVIDRLIDQVEAYKRHVPCAPKKDRTA